MNVAKRYAIPTKIIKPKTAKIIQRPRLLNVIDDCRSESKIIWLAAPGGSGKTTLVSSYIEKYDIAHCWYQIDEDDRDLATFFHYLGLAAKAAAPQRKKASPKFTPEFELGVPAFTRQFFTDLSSKLNGKGVIVFDNYQLLPNSNQLTSLLPCIAEAILPEVTLLIISRYLPPDSLIPLQVKRQLKIINAKQVRFEEDEWLNASKLFGKAFSPQQLQWLHEKLDGWVTGLILLPESATLDDQKSVAGLGIEVLDNYIVDQFISSLDSESIELLLQTCYLPHITGKSAKKISGITQAKELLTKLAEKNLFVLRQGNMGYTIHPLILEYLQNRVKDTYSSEQLNQLRLLSAKVLITEGNYEPAADLLCDLQEWSLLSELIIQKASELFESGRTQSLQRYINALPETFSSDQAWIYFWKGKLATYRSVLDAFNYFELAYQKFLVSSDVKGLYLSWYSAVSLICGTLHGGKLLSSWLDRYDELSKHFPKPPKELDNGVIDSILLHGNYFCGRNPEIRKHLHQRLARHLSSTKRSALRLQMMGIFAMVTISSGIKPEDKIILDQFEISQADLEEDPISCLSATIYFSVYLWGLNDYQKQLDLLFRAMEIAQKNGIRVFDSHLLTHVVIAALGLNKLELAKEYLNKLKILVSDNNQVFDSLYSTCLILAATSHIEFDNGIEEIIPKYIHNIESTHIAPFIIHHKLLYLYYLCNRRLLEPAMALHDDLMEFCGRVSFSGLLTRFYFIYAKIFFENNSIAQSTDYLKKAFSIARENRVIASCHWPPELMSWACERALQIEIETSYVIQFIDENIDKLPQQNSYNQQWPHPFRLYTFARFEITDKNGISILNQRASKSLSLLKVLSLSEGNKMSSATLREMLYADIDPKKVSQLVDTQVHRLRKQLNNENSIVRDGEQLALNLKYFWIDTLEFENLNKISVNENNALELVTRLLQLYKGEYLPGEDNLEIISRREYFRNVFLSIFLKCTELLKKSPDTVEGLCQDALRVEPLSEPIFRRLIVTYMSQGNRDMAEITLDRCRTLINRYYDNDVSSTTAALLENN